MLKITTADYYPAHELSYIKGIMEYKDLETNSPGSYDFSIRIAKADQPYKYTLTVSKHDQNGEYTARMIPLYRDPGCGYSIQTLRTRIKTELSLESFTRLLSDDLFQLWTDQLITNVLERGETI